MRANFDPKEMPHIVDWSMVGLLEEACRRAPEQTALKQLDFSDRSQDRLWDYVSLVSSSKQYGRMIAAKTKPGDHIALLAPNTAIWTLIQFGAAYAGVTLVTLNPVLQKVEIEYQLEKSEAKLLITERTFRDHDLEVTLGELKPVLPQLSEVIFMDEIEAMAQADWSCELHPAGPDDTAFIMFTSGTTGKPKAVMLSQRSIVNNAMLGTLRYEIADHQVWLNTLPLFHIGGAVTSTLGCLARVGTHLVMPTFDPAEILQLIEQEKVNWFPVVPTVVHALINHPTFDEADLSSLAFVLTGGTAIAPDFVREVEEKFGCGVQVMFGQTEAGGAMAKTYRDDDTETICNTVGVPYPCVAMKIQDVDTERPCEIGEIGEIRVKSPFMMKGYFKNDEETRAAFDDDGYLRTGDLGVMDANGYLKITGRLKDMIIRGGENIYAREVEDTLAAHPAVQEVAVIGLPDEKWGEEVAAFITLAPGQSADGEELLAFLNDKLARFKIPRIWQFVEDFPRTAMGKIKKFEVANAFAQHEA